MTEYHAKPWDNEPDFAEFIDDVSMYKCQIKRSVTGGGLCGYVVLPHNHPLYGKDIEDKDHPKINVHGGITYSSFNEDGEFLVGFDCQHGITDFIPKMFTLQKESAYKDFAFVKAECIKLAQELKKLESKKYK